MNARSQWRRIQEVLGTKQDGIPGPNDEEALTRLRLHARLDTEKWEPIAEKDLISDIRSAPGFAFQVLVIGDDLVVKNTRCTCFGGTNDPQDNGETASGISTKDPHVRGCALPRNYTGPHVATRRALEGSPIPERLPFRTPVEVTIDGKSIVVPFIDLGPARQTSNGLDLTIAAAREFNPHASATNFAARCDYRIIGGAKYL